MPISHLYTRQPLPALPGPTRRAFFPPAHPALDTPASILTRLLLVLFLLTLIGVLAILIIRDFNRVVLPIFAVLGLVFMLAAALVQVVWPRIQSTRTPTAPTVNLAIWRAWLPLWYRAAYCAHCNHAFFPATNPFPPDQLATVIESHLSRDGTLPVSPAPAQPETPP